MFSENCIPFARMRACSDYLHNLTSITVYMLKPHVGSRQLHATLGKPLIKATRREYASSTLWVIDFGISHEVGHVYHVFDAIFTSHRFVEQQLMAQQARRAFIQGLNEHFIRQITKFVEAKVQKDGCCSAAVNKSPPHRLKLANLAAMKYSVSNLILPKLQDILPHLQQVMQAMFELPLADGCQWVLTRNDKDTLLKVLMDTEAEKLMQSKSLSID